MPDQDTYAVGDRLVIWITGNLAEKRAVVVEGGTESDPYLKVEDDSTWRGFTLKPGDYVILERADDS